MRYHLNLNLDLNLKLYRSFLRLALKFIRQKDPNNLRR